MKHQYLDYSTSHTHQNPSLQLTILFIFIYNELIIVI